MGWLIFFERAGQKSGFMSGTRSCTKISMQVISPIALTSKLVNLSFQSLDVEFGSDWAHSIRCEPEQQFVGRNNALYEWDGTSAAPKPQRLIIGTFIHADRDRLSFVNSYIDFAVPPVTAGQMTVTSEIDGGGIFQTPYVKCELAGISILSALKWLSRVDPHVNVLRVFKIRLFDVYFPITFSGWRSRLGCRFFRAKVRSIAAKCHIVANQTGRIVGHTYTFSWISGCMGGWHHRQSKYQSFHSSFSNSITSLNRRLVSLCCQSLKSGVHP